MSFKRTLAALLSAAVAVSGVQAYAVNAAAAEPSDGVSVAEEESGEETETPDTWEANFVYNEETGILSWDDYINDDESLKYETVFSTDGVTNSVGGIGWGDIALNIPNVNLPLCFSVFSIREPFVGNFDVYVQVLKTSDNTLVAQSADSFTYSYDGCDVNAELEVPELQVNGKEVIWNATEGAVAYLYSNDKSTVCGFSGSSGEHNIIVYQEAFEPVSVCAVDKNGDRSEWSEFAVYEGESGNETEDTWEANFVYNEETGILSWDHYTVPKEGERIQYNVAFKSGDYYTEVICFSSNNGGQITNPSVSLPFSLGVQSVINENSDRPTDLGGDYSISVRTNDGTNYIISSDSFSYTFYGKFQSSDVTVPKIKSVRILSDGTEYVKLSEDPAKTIGLIAKIYNDDFSHYVMMYEPDFSQLYFTGLNLPINSEFYTQICTIDINGSTSQWSEPYSVTIKTGLIDENGYYVYDTEAGAIEVPISENTYTYDIKIPGVIYHETTVGELKEICKGIIINGFGFSGSSVDGLTAEDIFFGIIVQTDNNGSVWGGWNAVYDDVKMDFDSAVSVNDSEIVRSTIFQVGLTEEAIEKFGLKPEDIVTIYVNSDKSFVYEGNTFTYTENQDGLTITGGTIVNPDVVIPAEINGKPVTEIGMYAFNFNNNIETLVIPENVKRIDRYAFNTCQKLTEVTLPESLEYIESRAFERCFALKEITVPKNVTYVGSGAFAQNTSMTSVECDPLNSAYVSVGGVLFTKDMKELTAYPGGRDGAYTVPESVEHIGNAAFYGAKKLTAVEISGTLDFIGFEAFAECELLTDVYINDGVDYVGYWAFRGCSGIKQLTVPQSVTNIGNQAFGFRYADNKFDGFSLRGYKDSAIYYYALRHDIPFIIIGDADGENSPFKDENAKEEKVEADPDAKEEDSITSITINPAFNMKDKSEAGVGLDLTKITIKANEIYQDEESIRRAEEALGEAIKGNKHYNLLDLTLLYDGEDFSDRYDGLVEVIIPIPAGHRDKEFYCYRIVDNNGTPEKELIPGKRVEDSYIIYLEHFSTYAVVGDGDHEHSFRESWESDSENHWHECSCGEITDTAAHTASEPVTENGIKYTECTVCGRRLSEEEVSDADTPSEPDEPAEPSEPTEPSTGTSGGFILPETTTAALSPDTDTPDESVKEPSDIGTSEGTEGAADNGSENAPSDTAQGENGVSEPETGSDNIGANNTGSDPEDKNQNTGVTLAVIPFAAAAVSLIFFKKRK